MELASVTTADTSELPVPELIRVRIAKLRAEAEDIRGLELVSEEGGPLPAFKAGAHIDIGVILPGRQRTMRSYSLASPPSEQPYSYLVGVQYEEKGTGGSIFLHENVRSSYVLEISPPKNFFPLAENAEHSILIAGGIGVTPILAMAHELDTEGKSFELHYVARPARMAFREHVTGFGERAHVYQSGGSVRHGGLDLRAVMKGAGPGRHAYVCGPAGMIEEVKGLGRELGWPETNVHSEVFTKPEPRSGDGPVEVVVRSTGQVIQVAANKSILDALVDARVPVDFDCRVGTCGTCAVQVLEGIPDHRDNVLLDSEKTANRMCICVSRAATPRLVLDV